MPSKLALHSLALLSFLTVDCGENMGYDNRPKDIFEQRGLYPQQTDQLMEIGAGQSYQLQPGRYQLRSDDYSDTGLTIIGTNPTGTENGQWSFRTNSIITLSRIMTVYGSTATKIWRMVPDVTPFAVPNRAVYSVAQGGGTVYYPIPAWADRLVVEHQTAGVQTITCYNPAPPGVLLTFGGITVVTFEILFYW